jgi:type I restriction enzyme M protein
VAISDKDQKSLYKFIENKPIFDGIIETLRANVSDKLFLSPKPFVEYLSSILSVDKKWIEKVADGLSIMDKSAEIQRDKKGNVIYDKTTAETEIVKIEEDINDYMEREVLPHLPDAVAFFEEVITEKKTVIKTGADIAFTRYFYQYQQPEASQNLEKKFLDLDKNLSERIKNLFGV